MGKKFFIVVVEDDEAIRTAFVELLKIEGFDVKAFSGGREAKDYIDSLPRFAPDPDVILTDVNMPEMDGIKLANYLKREKYLYKNKPPLIVVMSGERENKDIALLAGADIFLLKPIIRIGEKMEEFLKNR